MFIMGKYPQNEQVKTSKDIIYFAVDGTFFKEVFV